MSSGAHTEGKGIDKETNQAFRLGAISAGNRRTYDGFLLAGVAIEKNEEGRKQDHVCRRRLAIGEGFQLVAQLDRNEK